MVTARNTVTTSPQVEDEFDLDVQISVLEKNYDVQLGNTGWFSCQGNSCSCTTRKDEGCGTAFSINACC